jgi:hypothetical protein
MVFPYVSINSGVEMRHRTGTINPTALVLQQCMVMKAACYVEKPYAIDQISSQTVHDHHEILSNVHVYRAAKSIECPKVYAYVKELEKHPHKRAERRQAHASND